jgi:hypothetical protein
MAQILVFPQTHVFTREFEELPLFSQRAPNGDLFYAGLIDGSIEISFNLSGHWWISDLHIAVGNARRGQDGIRRRIIHLNPDESPALYWLALDVFTDKYADTIDEWMHEEAARSGVQIAA